MQALGELHGQRALLLPPGSSRRAEHIGLRESVLFRILPSEERGCSRYKAPLFEFFNRCCSRRFSSLPATGLAFLGKANCLDLSLSAVFETSPLSSCTLRGYLKTSMGSKRAGQRSVAQALSKLEWAGAKLPFRSQPFHFVRNGLPDYQAAGQQKTLHRISQQRIERLGKEQLRTTFVRLWWWFE